MSIILVIPARCSSYSHWISPYLMAFVKFLPWNVKTTPCQHSIWDEDSTAVLDQLWCSTCVLVAGDSVGGHGFVLSLTLVTPRCHPQTAQGTGINSPPPMPGSRITNIKWFQLVFFSWRSERRELTTDLLCQHVMAAVSVQDRALQLTNSFPGKHQLGISSTALTV